MTNFSAVEWYQQKLERDIAGAAENKGAERLRLLAAYAYGAAMAMDCRTAEQRFHAIAARAETLALEVES